MGEWQPIETAPRDGGHVVGYTACGSVVRMFWQDQFDGENGTWLAVTDGEHPACWTDGVCWAVNESEEPSDPPVLWAKLPNRESTND